MTLSQLRQLQQSAARSRRGSNRQRASILRATGREPETKNIRTPADVLKKVGWDKLKQEAGL